MDFKASLAKLLKKEVKTDVLSLLEVPPDPKLGDFALPCFSFAKTLKKAPPLIAQDLAKKIKAPFLDKIEVKGPYLNFFVKDALLAKGILSNLKKRPASNKQKVLVEFPSPNTNKPLHLGHLRNMFLGQSISHLLDYSGYKVFSVNLNNDRGVHICKSMLAYQKWAKSKTPDKKSDHYVGDLYVLYNKHENDETKKEIQKLLVKWEEGDKPTLALWKKMNSWAIKGFEETYGRLGVKFGATYNESEHYGEGRNIVLAGLKKGAFAKDEDGAVFADLTKWNLDKKVLLRPDGTSIYMTQDINLAVLRHKKYKFDRCIYVVGSEQNYHFKALFAILEILGYQFAKHCHHLSYGMVYLPHGRMKSREGTVIDADNLLDKMEELAAKEVKKRDKSLSAKEVDKRAIMIGHAALRFFLLKMDAVKDIHFHPEESLSFEGETGPYVQYAHARICSVLKKAKSTGKANHEVYDSEEINLIKKLGDFSSSVESAAENLRPHILAHYVLELAQEFNTYYATHQILKEKENIKQARLFLINQIKVVLSQGLKLLHIDAPEQM